MSRRTELDRPGGAPPTHPPLRLAVIGCGYMGRLHANKIAELALESSELEFSGVADRHATRARLLARAHGVRGVVDHRELIALSDAAIVAVPTVSHAQVARAWLEAGRDLLIEKPVAATVEEALDLLQLARSEERVVQVGHVEWYNAALEAMRDRIQQPRYVEAHRLGPFPARSTDIDVVRDLMIHDIDIVQRLVGDEPDRIEAIGVPVLTDSIDIANARLHFPNGSVASLTASRVSPSPLRRVRFFQKDGFLSIDLLDKSAVIMRRDAARGALDPEAIQTEEIKVERSDALLLQLREFVHASRQRRLPMIDASDGLNALRTATRVIEAMPEEPPAGG